MECRTVLSPRNEYLYALIQFDLRHEKNSHLVFSIILIKRSWEITHSWLCELHVIQSWFHTLVQSKSILWIFSRIIYLNVTTLMFKSLESSVFQIVYREMIKNDQFFKTCSKKRPQNSILRTFCMNFLL